MAGNWPNIKFGELADSISETHSLGKEQLIFLNTSDVLHGKILHQSYSPVKDWPGQAKKSIRKGDILFSEIRPANGRYAYVDIKADDYVVSTKLMVIRAKDRVLSKYLYHYLISREITNWLQHLAESRSGTFPQITFDQVADLQLRLPPMEVQEVIVAFIDALDDKIELNRRMNATLEAMARAIFQSWFVDFDPVRAKAEGRQPEGIDADTAALFPDSFDDSPLGKIPKGWRVGNIGDLASNRRIGVDPSQLEIGTPYIGLEHMPRKSIALFEWGQADGVASNKFRFYQGDILFGKLRPYFHKVGVAPLDGVCSTDILVILPKKPPYFALALAHVSSEDLIQYVDAASTGTKMPRTNWHDIARYEMVISDENVMKKLDDEIRPMIDSIKENIHESRTLAVIRDALLPKLLSGEVRVKDAEKMAAWAGLNP